MSLLISILSAKNFQTMVVKLTLRYVKGYSPVVTDYYSLIGEGDYVVDESGNSIIGGE